MVISNGLKKVIFKKLYEDLAHVEIISYNNSIWFIDRENKYWYLEYDKDGTLFWRYPFFNNFFLIFSLESDEYKPIISEWVEEVLNCKVVTTGNTFAGTLDWVEEVLNCKVVTTGFQYPFGKEKVEEVLNCKVVTTLERPFHNSTVVEEVLNCKVVTTIDDSFNCTEEVEEVLKYKVVTTDIQIEPFNKMVEEVLNSNGKN